jgi:hypothetical protein
MKIFGDFAGAIASKPAPTLGVHTAQNFCSELTPCGSELAREEAISLESPFASYLR